MKFRKLAFVFILLSFISFFGCSTTPKENDITVAELHAFLEDANVVVLDVRTPEEIALGKITAEALEVDFYDAAFMEDTRSKITKDQTVYVYCRSGRRSAETVSKLRELGYLKTYNVEGGIIAWEAEGFAIEK
ncbi:Thiosulfate sulfurtransferase GlpE [Kordia antarctica]|uniref:Thiosulfate sulfurtransferase GlpE n=1 Tax=Kordia antarctica TaxID=1218801 RepID=A0A7L4ZPS3_9FLAO|nr:rhodanese-like domain-containing protein [Kordia antarctica]QHI38738.1 Thiosulfate sulfurtransferase GlpE [Kordia antarctica]